MRQLSLLLAFVAAVLLGVHACSSTVTDGNVDGGGDMNAMAGLYISPSNPTISVMQGNVPNQTFTATYNGADVSTQAVWTDDNPGLGMFQGNVFVPSGTQGGTTTITVSYMGQTATTTLTVTLTANITTTTCPGCPPFPPSTTPMCSGSARNATVIYPPNNTLVPPNMNVIRVQFDQGTGNTLFEIDFENQLTDVRVETKCNAITDSKGLATNGCSYDLDQTVWNYIAQTNRGGSPVAITVKATDASGSCVATSPATNIQFGQDDLNAGLYYWQSVALGGVQGKTGGIFRYDFGKRGQAPDAFLSPTSTSAMTNCIGCHFLSRDGKKMTFGSDDADADDEYGDLSSFLIDVATKTVPNVKLSPGFQTFSSDTAVVLASDGKGMNNPPSFFVYDANTAGTPPAPYPAKVPSGGARGTHPDWAPNGTSIVFVRPTNFFNMMGAVSATGDDEHFYGGSLYTMSFDTTAKTFGTPAVLLASGGENNYYPAYSPDNAFVVFNRAPAGATMLAGDAFSNINARVMMMKASAGSAPFDLPALNSNGTLTNSWPRFAPVIQNYKGHRLVWVTFSSTRDYGDQVRNSINVNDGTGNIVPQINCYPSESPENPNGSKTQPLANNCHQPQLWMAALDLDVAGTGSDPSFPAFWLPFQDPTAHNHIAQWVVSIVGNTGGSGMDGGTACKQLGQTCTAGVDTCCGGVCSGTCLLP